MPTPDDAPSWPALRLRAAEFGDVQRLRIALNNRHGRAVALAEAKGHPELGALVTEAVPFYEMMASLEDLARRNLRTAYRAVVPAPLRAWQAATLGAGEHLTALLLGSTGHPGIAVPLDKDGAPTGDPYHRDLRDWWAYCGHGAPLRRRTGMTEDDARAMGAPTPKRTTHLLAEGAIKARNPDLRALYDARRARTAVTHDDWTPGHSHADALRLVGKEMLRGIWRAAQADLAAGTVLLAA
jgi:hypothetical protein